MAAYTVVGFWVDTMQRFSTHVVASDADAAEELCAAQSPGMAVCGVFLGELSTIESAEFVLVRDFAD